MRSMKNLNVAICSIVRDCDSSLKNNIPVVEELRSNFKNSCVVVFENDSIDKTKKILNDWKNTSKNVHVFFSDTGEKTIEECKMVNKYFSSNRISKMARYRNRYLEELDRLDLCFDYVIVVDLDVVRIDLNGVYDSFSKRGQWDIVTANGYSYSPRLKRRYHDSYALVEMGQEMQVQTEKSVYQNQKKWAFFKKSMPLFPVYSAFGGLAIYRYEILKGKRYSMNFNNDSRVEVECEHTSLHRLIREEYKINIFINPNMELLYQKISFGMIMKRISRIFSRR